MCIRDSGYGQRESEVHPAFARREPPDYRRRGNEDAELDGEVEQAGTDSGEREKFTGNIDLLDEPRIADDRGGADDDDVAEQLPRRQAREDEDGEVRDASWVSRSARCPEEFPDGDVV